MDEYESLPQTKGMTIASRYLASMCSCGPTNRADLSAFSAISGSDYTPERKYRPSSSFQRKIMNDSACGMTATTAGLETSASWSSANTPTRSDAALSRINTSMENNSFLRQHSMEPEQPFGIEDDCSSIDSSSSHSRNRPAHFSAEMEDSRHESSQQEKSFSSTKTPIFPTSPSNRLPSPSQLIERAKEHLANHRSRQTQSENHGGLFAGARTRDVIGSETSNIPTSPRTPQRYPRPKDRPLTSPNRKPGISSPPQIQSTCKVENGQRFDFSARLSRWQNTTKASFHRTHYPLHSNVTKRPLPAVSEASAPTEVATNRIADAWKRSDDFSSHVGSESEAGAPTEVMTNRVLDVLKRHLATQHPSLLSKQQQQIQQLSEPPKVKRWKVASPPQDLNANLIDQTSTFDDSIDTHDPRNKSLLDIHSTGSKSFESNSTKESPAVPPNPWRNSRNVIRKSPVPKDSVKHFSKPSFGGRPTGGGSSPVGRPSDPSLRGAKMGPEQTPTTELQHHASETKEQDSAPRFYMGDFVPQPRVPKESSSGDLTSSISTTDFLLNLDIKHCTERAAIFVRYNKRQTPNAHEVFQRRYSDSSGDSTLSTLDKEQEAGFICSNPIQPLFSLDRLDLSPNTRSPLRTHRRSKSQGEERFTTSSLRLVGSRSFDDSLQRDMLMREERQEQRIKQPGKKSEGAQAATRFAVKRDLDQPDPIFCPDGSMSMSSKGIETSVITESSSQDCGEFRARTSEVRSPSFSKGESSGTVTSYDEELVQIMNDKDSATSTAPPRRSNSVTDKIKVFNRMRQKRWTPVSKPPTKETAPFPRNLITGAHLASTLDDENKAEVTVDVSPILGGSIRTLKEKFEQREKKEQDSNLHEYDIDDDDTASVKSLRDKIELQINSDQYSLDDEDDDDDDGSVRSLRERFEAPVTNRERGAMVSSLRSKFESNLKTTRVSQSSMSRGSQSRSSASYRPSPTTIRSTPHPQRGVVNSSPATYHPSSSSTRSTPLSQFFDDEQGDEVNRSSVTCRPSPNTTRFTPLSQFLADKQLDAVNRSSDTHRPSPNTTRSTPNSQFVAQAQFDAVDKSSATYRPSPKTARSTPLSQFVADKQRDVVNSAPASYHTSSSSTRSTPLSQFVADEQRDAVNRPSAMHRKSPNTTRSTPPSYRVADEQRGAVNSATNPDCSVDSSTLPQDVTTCQVSRRNNVIQKDQHSGSKDDHAVSKEVLDPHTKTIEEAVSFFTEKATLETPEGGDEDTLSTVSSGVRGPAPTSFLSTRDRLLKFSHNRDEAPAQTKDIRELTTKAAPPTMKERLNLWANRYQARKQSTVESFSSKYVKGSGGKPKTDQGEKLTKPSSPSTAEGGKMETEEKQANEIVTKDEDALGKAVRVPDCGDNREDQPYVRRSDPRSKSNDSEFSDGVTLDASIAEVSLLTEATLSRTKGNEAVPDEELNPNSSPARNIHTSSGQPTEILSPLEDEEVSTKNMFPAYNESVSDDLIIDLENTTSLVGETRHKLEPRVMTNAERANQMATEPPDLAVNDLHNKTGTTMGSEANGPIDTSAEDSTWNLEKVEISFSYDAEVDKRSDAHIKSNTFEIVTWPTSEDDIWFDFPPSKPKQPETEAQKEESKWTVKEEPEPFSRDAKLQSFESKYIEPSNRTLPRTASPRASTTQGKSPTSSPYRTQNPSAAEDDGSLFYSIDTDSTSMPHLAGLGLDVYNYMGKESRTHLAALGMDMGNSLGGTGRPMPTASLNPAMSYRQRKDEENVSVAESHMSPVSSKSPVEPPGKQIPDPYPKETRSVGANLQDLTTVPSTRQIYGGRKIPSRPNSTPSKLPPVANENHPNAIPSPYRSAQMAKTNAPKKTENSNSGRHTDPSSPKRNDGNTGLISRITGTMGRTQNGHRSKHDKFIERLKNVKASRFRRKVAKFEPFEDSSSAASSRFSTARRQQAAAMSTTRRPSSTAVAGVEHWPPAPRRTEDPPSTARPHVSNPYEPTWDPAIDAGMGFAKFELDPLAMSSDNFISATSTPDTTMSADEIVRELTEMAKTGRSSLNRKEMPPTRSSARNKKSFTYEPDVTDSWSPFETTDESSSAFGSGGSPQRTPRSDDNSVTHYAHQGPGNGSRSSDPPSLHSAPNSSHSHAPTSYRHKYYPTEPDAAPPMNSRNQIPLGSRGASRSPAEGSSSSRYSSSSKKPHSYRKSPMINGIDRRTTSTSLPRHGGNQQQPNRIQPSSYRGRYAAAPPAATASNNNVSSSRNFYQDNHILLPAADEGSSSASDFWEDSFILD